MSEAQSLSLALSRVEIRRRESLELALTGESALIRMAGAVGALIAEVDAVTLRAFPAPPNEHLTELGAVARDLQELVSLLRIFDPPEENGSVPAASSL